MNFYVALFAAFLFATLPPAAVTFGVGKLLPKAMGWIVVPLVAVLTGWALGYLSVDWVGEEIRSNPANANVDGPQVFVAVMTVIIQVAAIATALAFVASLATWLKIKRRP